MFDSVLRRSDNAHPFAPFRSNDLPGCEKLFEAGFDPMWQDGAGMTCAMEAASRGHGAALNLALRKASDSEALALAKAISGMDAFDMAAACGSTACMSVLAKRLPGSHRSAIGRGLPWHAVEASLTQPHLAFAWLVDLCARGMDADVLAQAIERAAEIGWREGQERLEAAARRAAPR